MAQNVLSEYYGQQYQQSMDPSRSMDTFMQQDLVPDMVPGMVDTTMVGEEGQTLDQIISQNELELQRRRSTLNSAYQPNGDEEADAQRSSMLDFASSKHPDRPNFQFDPSPPHPAMSGPLAETGQSQKTSDPRKLRSRESLALDTRFNRMNPAFGSISSYSPAMMSSTPLDLDHSAQFLSNMEIPMGFDGVSGDRPAMNVQPQIEQQPQQAIFPASPTHQTFSPMFQNMGQDSPAGRGASMDQSLMDRVSRMRMPDAIQNIPVMKTQGTEPRSIMPTTRGSGISAMASPAHPPPSTAPPNVNARIRSPYGNGISNGAANEVADHGLGKPPQPQFVNIYSASGFDMLGVLMRVAARPKPEINIGPVDLSCAFVVCDISLPDMPIVYCSDVFERLTAYSNQEIVGRNCRFLQAPDGKVQPGVRRKYVDDNSVLSLKQKISRREEIQLSLINYRKGGQPFMNLLTMIPVAWDTREYKYYVGFQVDLVEQPNSVAGKNPDGTYAINYQRNQLPPYVLKTPDTNTLQGDIGQTIGRDEVSAVLSTIGSGESELSKRIWDKVLLENTDDVVHVLSLKGLFLYLSPASRKVLEYDASELVGTALSSVCHPSDIVPVTRELKDTSSGASVNVVFRIRRKHSGYTWFESHGCLHTEQGKGRKCIIMVGRERPVYATSRTEVTANGGIGDSELWSKMSTSGMFLFVSTNCRALLDRSPAELVGTSIQAMMRAEAKKEFTRVLELARTGKKSTTFKHEMQNRRGQVLQAQTTIYPGDAEEGSKPTFLVAQTRFLKMSRSTLPTSRPSIAPSPRTDQASVGSTTSSTNVTPPPTTTTAHTPSRPPITPQSSQTPLQTPGFDSGVTSQTSAGLCIGNQAEALASDDNIFDELKTTRSTSWQFELRQMEKQNRILIEELQGLLSRRKKRKRRKGFGQMEKDCANCHTRVTPEWRRGPSGRRDLCNSCGLRWAKQSGRVSPRKTSGDQGEKSSNSPLRTSPPEAGLKSPHHHQQQQQQPQQPPAAGGGSTTMHALKKMPKLEPATSGGSLPPRIDEGTEPPHSDILPT
ncbi:hypothetical protein EPUS_04524 [Endocarpon pusillum Z07020]|uniref:White collar 1 protein n=1 Tax=Endocarpon pusillum (strain Z07020 / HMAS-L-300199) TaxID=1263415 RepID=U1FVL5_ENDPU|nr:uncharacterized protein EPUS_04524 [Endocarpon pusillum Z07020]ERF68872.1 hypothetical protein EPUS_04524 [Endocarpon pusillum Z07020]